MRIGIDMSRTTATKTGLSSYAHSLVAGLARIDTVNEYLLYPFGWYYLPEEFRSTFCPDQKNFRLSRARMPKPLVRYLFNHSKIDNDWLIGGDPDVYFSPFHSTPPRHCRRLVSVFHDVAFRVHPEFSTQMNLEHCEWEFEQATLRADRMVTVSHFSKAEIVKHMGVPEDWVTVTHEAADPMFQKLPGARLPERIRREIGTTEQVILYVGSVEPRKNLATLVRAFDALVQRGRCQPTLVIGGGSGWLNSDLHEEIGRRRLNDRIHFAGFVTDEELVQLYNACTIFVYPTIYEGFGLPVIEAMGCGIPVVTTRVTSIPEVGGDAVVYIDDPHDEDSLCARMEELLLAPELRQDLSARGLAQAATFNWDRTARETLAVLEEVHTGPAYARRAVQMGVDERGLVKGWHSLASDGDKPYRWSHRHATLRLLLGHGSLLIEAATDVPGEQQVLGVRAHGHLIGHCALTQEWQTFRIPIPELLPLGQEVEISLDANFEVPPSIKGEDPRQLGARVARVACE